MAGSQNGGSRRSKRWGGGGTHSIIVNAQVPSVKAKMEYDDSMTPVTVCHKGRKPISALNIQRLGGKRPLTCVSRTLDGRPASERVYVKEKGGSPMRSNMISAWSPKEKERKASPISSIHFSQQEPWPHPPRRSR